MKESKSCRMKLDSDASGNPSTFAAMLMAGLDGIRNKIDPGNR